MNDLRILVTGCGAIVAPSIIKNYKEVKERSIYVVGVDIKKNVSNKYIDKFYQCKKASDEEYIPTLIKICKKEKINFIIPLVDDELLTLAKNKERLRGENIIVCINDASKIELVQDKYKLYNFLKENNIDVPNNYKFETIKELKNGCKLLGFPKNTLCYKPFTSSGSRGFRIIKKDIDYEEYLFNNKPTSKYINYEFLIKSMEKCKKIPQMLLMEYIEGDLYNVNILAKKGKTLYSVAGKVLDFEIGNTIKCKIENNKEVLEYCKKITKLLKLNGNIGFEVAYDKNKVLKLIEINIRIQGQIYSSTLAGINFPYLELKYYLKEKLPINIRPKEIIMNRYLEDIIVYEK